MKIHLSNVKYFLILLTILGGCNFLDSEKDSKELIGPTWELVEIRDTDNALLCEPGTDWSYWIKFLDDGNITGKEACNDCAGSFTKNDTDISINFICTEMGCSDPLPSCLGYGNILNYAVDYEIISDRLKVRIFSTLFGERILIHKATE